MMKIPISIHKIEKAITNLALPEKPKFHDVIDSVSRKNGLEIHFIPCSMPLGLSGFVLYGQAIHILYNTNVSPLHQIQIKLHEIGHVVLDHQQSELDAEEERLLETFLHTHQTYENLMNNVALRHKYLSTEEKEAEIFATLLVTRLHLEMQYKDDPFALAGLT